MTNDELAAKVDTSDAWIVERTGIRQRHIAAEGEFTSDLAFKAAERALSDAGMVANDVDMIVVLGPCIGAQSHPDAPERIYE